MIKNTFKFMIIGIILLIATCIFNVNTVNAATLAVPTPIKDVFQDPILAEIMRERLDIIIRRFCNNR